VQLVADHLAVKGPEEFVAAAILATARMTANLPPDDTGLLTAAISEVSQSLECAPGLHLLLTVASLECAPDQRRFCKQAVYRCELVILMVGAGTSTCVATGGVEGK
jgi:hypothetical protein